MRKFVSRYIPTTAALLCAGVAIAQDGDELVLEEVIVTAQQRVESLQDVPVSVNAVAGEKISEAGIEKIEDIALYVPNLSMSETGIGTNLYLRGIGSGINNGFEQSVGMYVDGIYYGRPQLTRVPFLDLERVEVLRGPQMILFGKNSIAGAISMITAKPTDEFEASVSGLYEVNFNEREITAIVSGPLVEGLRGRVAIQKRDIDGYIDNITLGRDEPQRDELFVRGTLAWDVTPDLDVSLKIEYGEFDVTGRQVEITADQPILPIADYFVPPTLAAIFPGQSYAQVLNSLGADASVLNTTQDFDRSASGPEFSNNVIKNVTLTGNWALGEHTLTSITGYLNYEFVEECDCDFTGANIFTVPAQENFEQFS
ncbi:MAG: TonB-dependent receptor plug domain-containing protein, partial [Gammaproteobacteria bacterium]|nr:TonB-dependent receptor plug domain-containing protein [Gammaproteobacteria bacterium]